MSHSGNDPSRQTRWVWYIFLLIEDEKHPFTWKSSNVAPSQGGDAEEGGDQIQREGLFILLQMMKPNRKHQMWNRLEREKTATSLGAPRPGDHDDVDVDLDQPRQGDHDADHLESRYQIIVSATPKSKIMPNYLRIPTNQAPLGSQP